MNHTCHATKCFVEVPPKLFMCKKHWYMLPREIRSAVWATYVPGQEVRKDPSRAYLEVTQQAIAYVERAEAEA